MQSQCAIPTVAAWFVVLLAFTTPARSQEILFVDADAPGTNNGMSWPDAFNHLQDALAAAAASGSMVNEVRVAQGTYKPDRGKVQTLGNRNAAFQLLDGVALKGGYAGFGEPDPNSREVAVYVTVLSGDLEGDDQPNFVNNAENSYHVTAGSATDASAILDGFTITGGNADGSNPNDRGGGMLNLTGSPTIAACTFAENAAQAGGGICNLSNAAPMVVGSAFRGNAALAAGCCSLGGGAMYNRSSSPTIIDCQFEGNTAAVAAGAIYNVESSSPTIIASTFRANEIVIRSSLILSAGAIDNTDRSSPILIDCTFIENIGTSGGAVGSFLQSNASIFNGTFIGNKATNANRNAGGGAIVAFNSDLRLENCIFIENSVPDESGWGGGAVWFKGGEAYMNECLFVKNSTNTRTGGGAVNAFLDSQLLCSRCVFLGNATSSIGGAIREIGTVSTLVNCLIAGNRSIGLSSLDGGGGFYSTSSAAPVFDSCTIVGNETAFAGGGLRIRNSTPVLNSCVLWDNRDASGAGESAQITAPAATTDYNCVQGWTGSLGGAGNIGDDPLFAGGATSTWTANASYDPMAGQTMLADSSANWRDNELAGKLLNPATTQVLQTLIVSNTATTIVAWGDFTALAVPGVPYKINDYHLSAASPCVDTGDPNFVLQPGQLADIDGELRLWDGDGNGSARVDMGADEFGSFVFGDLNCDGRFNGADIDPFFLALGDPAAYQTAFPGCDVRLGDINLDGAFNGADIDAFFDALAGE